MIDVYILVNIYNPFDSIIDIDIYNMNREIQLKLPVLSNQYPKLVQEIKSTKTNRKINLNQIEERL